MALDSKSIRRDFPIFQRWEGKNPLVYLDNAATSHKPRAVIDAVNNYYERCNSNVHRSVHTLAEQAPSGRYYGLSSTEGDCYHC